jgi:hypothetical protein
MIGSQSAQVVVQKIDYETTGNCVNVDFDGDGVPPITAFSRLMTPTNRANFA